MLRFLVDNSYLQSRASGLQYRLSKRVNDRHRYESAPWGSIVIASAVHDGWISVGDFFLPLELEGCQVLLAQGEGWIPEIGCITCFEFGRLPTFCCRLKVGTRIIVKEPFMSNSGDATLLRSETRGIIKDVDNEGDILVKFDDLDSTQWIFKKNFCKFAAQPTAAKMARQLAQARSQLFVERHGAEILLRKFQRLDTKNDGLLNLNALEGILGHASIRVLAGCLGMTGPKTYWVVRYEDLIKLLFPGEQAGLSYTLRYEGRFSHPLRGHAQLCIDLESSKRGCCTISGQEEVITVNSIAGGRIIFELFGGETCLSGQADTYGTIFGSALVGGQPSGSFQLRPVVTKTEPSVFTPSNQDLEDLEGITEEASCPNCSSSLVWINRYDTCSGRWKCQYIEKCMSRAATRGPYRWCCQRCSINICCRCGPKVVPRLLRELTPLRPTSNFIGIHDWITIGAHFLKRERGCFYHEVKLGPALGSPQVGWLTCEFDVGEVDGIGVGSDEHGWAADGVRHLKWHCGSAPSVWPRTWQVGDIIGCLLDIDAGTMKFSLNGTVVPTATMGFNASGRSFFPAVSMSGDFLFHIAREDWCYPPVSESSDAWAIWGHYRRTEGSMLVRPGARVRVVQDFLSDSNIKVKLHRGSYGFILRVDEEGDALIDFNEYPQKREWIFRSNFCNLRFLETQQLQETPPELSVLDKSGPSLLGKWLYPAGEFAITETSSAQFLFFGERLEVDGPWMACSLPATGISYRLVLSQEGNTIMWQERNADTAPWESPRFAMRQGQLADGAALITTQSCTIWTSTGFSRKIGSTPSGTRLIAAGPRIDSMVPIRPEGAVELRCVRLSDSFEPICEQAAYASSKYTSLSSIWEALASGDTVLVQGSWLQEFGDKGTVLPHRQMLPSKACWRTTELQNLVESRKVPCVALSYCWMSSRHPDPERYQLQKLAFAIERRLGEKRLPVEDIAMFFDWCSLYQEPRSATELAAFKRSLDTVSLWYVHSAFSTWLFTCMPNNSKAFHTRGWPTFEYSLTSIASENAKTLDLGRINLGDSCEEWLAMSLKCIPEKRPPVIPSSFSSALQDKVFSKRYEDMDFICGKYTEAFEGVISSVQCFDFGEMQWEAAEIVQVAETFYVCRSLAKLVLSDNNVGLKGALALASHLPNCTHLMDLQMRNVMLGSDGAEALFPVLPQLHILSVLNVQDNNLAERGASALAAVMPKCTQLRAIFLSRNHVSDGITEVVRVLRLCEALQELHIGSNGFTAPQKELLLAEWAASGKPEGSLVM